MNTNNVLVEHSQINAMPQIVIVAQASLHVWEAEREAISERNSYYDSIRHYERMHGPLERRITVDDPAHADVRSFTAETYKSYQAARRRVYNAKAQLSRACARLART
jgi:hypothetical protein